MNLQPQDRNQEIFPQFKNGRVINIDEKPANEWYQPFDGNKPNNAFQEQALYGIQNKSLLNQVFFSKANVKLVHDMLRYNVYLKSDKKYIIGPQSNIDLEITMRSTLLQHGRFLPYKITEQVEELNHMVVNQLVPRILSQIQQYLGFLWDIEHNPVPLELPKSMSNKGTRLLRSVTTTF